MLHESILVNFGVIFCLRETHEIFFTRAEKKNYRLVIRPEEFFVASQSLPRLISVVCYGKTI